jgi:hypothetical protein
MSSAPRIYPSGGISGSVLGAGFEEAGWRASTEATPGEEEAQELHHIKIPNRTNESRNFICRFMSSSFAKRKRKHKRL